MTDPATSSPSAPAPSAPAAPDYTAAVAAALTRAADHHRAGAASAALSAAGRAVQLGMSDTAALTALAVVQLEAGRTTAALPALDRAVRLAPLAPRPRQLRAQAWWALGRKAEAVAELRKAVVAALHDPAATLPPCPSPGYALALAELGEALVEGGAPDQLEQAAVLFRRALAVRGDLVKAWLGLAQLAQRQEQPEVAIATLRRACERHPGQAALQLALGEQLLAQDRTAEAATAFRAVLAAEPGSLTAQRGLAQAIQGPEAVIAWRRVVAACPEDAEACGRLAEALAEHGPAAEAVTLARRWVTLSEGADPAHALLNRLLASAGQGAGG